MAQKGGGERSVRGNNPLLFHFLRRRKRGKEGGKTKEK